MMNQISPRDQYIIYKEKERELELAIQRRLALEARGERWAAERSYPWYTLVTNWLKERIPFRAFQKQVVTEPAAVKEPCPGYPC